MENHAPQLLVAQTLVRGSQQRRSERQREEQLREPHAVAAPHPAWPGRFRLAIGNALAFVGQRLAGGAASDPRAT
jgi:hypothetical protein